MKKSEMWKNGLRQKNVAIKRNGQRKKKRQWESDEDRQSSCISSCHL